MQAGQHIFDNSHSSENTAILESSPNALACNRRWSLAANASSTKFDRTGRRLGIPANDVEERSLARTIRTDKGHDLARLRSEEHTSELQSLMRISYAVFCLKKKKKHTHTQNSITHTTITEQHFNQPAST